MVGREAGSGKRECGMRDAGCGMRAKAIVRPSSMRHAFELASIPLRMASSGTGKSYRDLRVWDEAISLALEVYRITESFPQAERFGLTSQLRRAVVAIASNIAEGHARSTRGEYKNFLSIARGSGCGSRGAADFG